MDFDLLPDILNEAPSSSNRLLHDLPSSRLISETDATDDATDHKDHRQSSSPYHTASSNNTTLLTSAISTPVKSQQLDPENTSVLSYQTGSAISKIEEICEAMTDCIIGRRNQFSIHLKSRNVTTANGNEDSKAHHSSRSRVVQFPNSSPREAWKFSRSDSNIRRLILMTM